MKYREPIIQTISVTPQKRKEMLVLIRELKRSIAKTDKMKKDIDYRKISFSSSPKQTKALIEEIQVPSLELIKDDGAKKK